MTNVIKISESREKLEIKPETLYNLISNTGWDQTQLLMVSLLLKTK
jgi:uncharacterized protein YtpQ (UPF0354 family)